MWREAADFHQRRLEAEDRLVEAIAAAPRWLWSVAERAGLRLEMIEQEDARAILAACAASKNKEDALLTAKRVLVRTGAWAAWDAWTDEGLVGVFVAMFPSEQHVGRCVRELLDLNERARRVRLAMEYANDVMTGRVAA